MASFNNMANKRDNNRKRRDSEHQYYSNAFPQSSFDNPQKKMRLDRELIQEPSKVLYVSNVPIEMDDTTVSYLAVPFGYIENIVFVRKFSQVLIEMKDLTGAVNMVSFFSKCVPLLHGKKLFIRFSKHQQINSKHESIKKVVDQANEKRKHYLNNWIDNKNGASEILCILIDKAPNLIINHLVFYKIFSRFGKILRIVSYTKKEQHFGLVEFEDPLAAHVAKLQLNNSRLLGDVGKMKIDFSKVAGPLQVERQSDKVRDYSKRPIDKSDQHEMRSPHYDFPLFCDNSRSDSMDRGSRVSSLMNLPDPRRSVMTTYDERDHQYNDEHNGADLVSAIRLMRYLNPSARNRMFRN